ncbi:MAG: heparinase II/III family protein, partial [bacterium]|nr:heparinase II/III family protein [bacterium]
YCQAHFLGCSHGLLAFSCLFWEKHSRAAEWAGYLRGVFEIVMKMLPTDGFYPHGINLWIYEHSFLSRYLELFRCCFGLNDWNTIRYWRNASRFRQASLSPDGMSAITFGDPQYRVGGDAWIHYLIASRLNDSSAQYLAEQLATQPVVGVDFRNAPARRRVWEFLFFNADIPARRNEQERIFFVDGGQLFLRQTDQSPPMLITARAGYPLGMQRYQQGEWSGYGHSDPCNGAFLVYRGNSFIFCGPGPVYRRDTALHNTITFDDFGQIGDGMVWAPEFIPENKFASISHIEDQNAQSLKMDLTPCYLTFLGVQKLIRRFILIPPSMALIDDRIELNELRQAQWNLHTYATINNEMHDDRLSFRFTERDQQARLIVLLPENQVWTSGLTEFVPAYPHSGQRDHYMRLVQQCKSGHFLTLLVFDDLPVNYQLSWLDDRKDRWLLKIVVEGKEYIFESDKTMAAE